MRIILLLVVVLSACTQAGDLPDGGFYYISTGGRWVVEQLPQGYPGKQITVSKEDGSIETVFSIDMGDVVYLCAQEKRECRELKRPQLMGLGE